MRWLNRSESEHSLFPHRHPPVMFQHTPPSCWEHVGSAGTPLMDEAMEGEDHRDIESQNHGTVTVGKDL